MKVKLNCKYLLLGAVLGFITLLTQVQPVEAFSFSLPVIPDIRSIIFKIIPFPNLSPLRPLPAIQPLRPFAPYQNPFVSPTVVPTATPTPTPTPTLTPTSTPILTPTPTPTPTPTSTPLSTETPIPTSTLTPTPTLTETPTPTLTSVPTETLTPTPTETPVPTPTEIPTPTLTETPTPTEIPPPTETLTPTPTPTLSAAGNLIAYWPMEETSGLTVPDISGNNHPLTINGTANWVSDAPITSFADTKSLSLDGATYAFSTSTSSDLCPQAGYTIEAWVKAPSSGLDSDEGIAGNFNGSGFLLYSSNHHSDKPFAALFNGGGFFAQTPTRDKGWHYISQTWDGAAVKIYIDGKEEGFQPFSEVPNCSGGTFTVGGYSFPNVHSLFTGRIDEVRLYDYARSAAEIVADGGITGNSFPEPNPTSTPTPTETPTPTLTPTPSETPTPTPPSGTQVVLNEFMPEPTNDQDWVEIYNTGETSADISGWKLADTAGIFETFLPGTTLNTGQFLTVTQFQRLNIGGDTIFLKDSSNNTIDSTQYTATDVQIDKSIGRSPDGTGSWQPCNISTQNATNNGSC